MSDLAHRRPQSVADAQTVDYTKALNYLGLSPGQPAAQALILVCQRYDLDPLLQHIEILDGKVYVKYAGYLHIANSSGHYEGAECVREWDDDTYNYATVRVHRDDRKFYAERTGKSRKVKPKRGGGTYEDDEADAKAFAQAHRRALRLAFNVDHPDPAEDHGDTSAPEPVVEVARMVDGLRATPLSPSAMIHKTSGKVGGDLSTSPDPMSDPASEAPPGPGSDLTSAAPSGPGKPPGGAADPTHPAAAVEEGDAIPADNDGEGWGAELGGQPPREAVAKVTTDPTPPIEQRSPVIAWCTGHGVSFGDARIYLANAHKADFGKGSPRPLRSINDMAELAGDDAARALAYLDAQFGGTDTKGDT